MRPGATYTVVSVGTNNITYRTPRKRIPSLQLALGRDVETMRRRSTGKWIWVLPQHPAVATVIRRVAQAHGDVLLAFKAGKDGYHPASYVALGRAAKSEMHP